MKFFLVVLAITGLVSERQPTQESREGEAQLPVPFVVATHTLRVGDIISIDDLAMSNGTPVPNNEAASILGKELKRTVYANQRLSARDFGARTMIERNANIIVEFRKGPLLITTEGRALEAGARGNVIRVMNTSSKIVFSAVIVDDNKVQVR